MALSVQSLSAAFSATQTYLVTGTVGDTVNVTNGGPTVTSITPISATIGPSGATFTASRVSPGGATVTFADQQTGEEIPVEVNHAGDPVSSPATVTGAIGTVVDVLITEQNDPSAFTISVDNTSVAAYNVTSNSEGRAVVVLTLNTRGIAYLTVDDGHGGTLKVEISVALSAASVWVKVAAMQAVVGGTYVATGDTTLALEDATSGYNGSGGYTISLTNAGKFVVTNGIPPAESQAQINVAAAVVRPDGTLYLADGRTLQVTTTAVNSTINFFPNEQGSYLAEGVVTMDTLGPDVKDLLSTSQSGDTEPPSPYQGELFFNTTTNVFEVFESGKWITIAAVGASATLSGLSDVKISTPSGGEVLTWNATDGKWENTSPSAAPIQSVSVIAPIVNTGSAANPVIGLDTPLPVADGGSGSTHPSLVAGTGIDITGSWPDQTITNTASAANGSLPLVNGDTPGPGVMADANGQCIAVFL